MGKKYSVSPMESIQWQFELHTGERDDIHIVKCQVKAYGLLELF